MKNKPIKVLLVDDDEDDYILAKDLLMEIPTDEYKINWEKIDWVSSFDLALKSMCRSEYDIYLVDYRLGKDTGIDLLKEARKKGCKSPVIMLTGKGDKQIDIEAMKAGASDYLVKDQIDSFLLERAIRYALERSDSIKALRQSERKFKNVFDKSRDIICLINKNGEILDANIQATKVFEFPYKELIKLNIQSLFIEEVYKEDFQKQLAEKNEIIDYELVMSSRSGEKVYAILTVVPQSDDGDTTYQAIIHDISKRKKAEQDLRNIEKLAVTGRIARTIAHEVRNPLTNVNLSLEQLKNEIQVKDESLDLYFDIITRNCERINQLITELLNSAKPASLQFEKHVLFKVLDDSIALAEDRLHLKKIKIIREFEEPGCEVSIDVSKVKIALLNIIINAIEAMEPENGVLKLESYTNVGKCFISIADNGTGISKENLDKLFEPFFSGKPKGMGLGLTAAQNIILNHKGSIDVESELGKGTTFVIGFNLD